MSTIPEMKWKRDVWHSGSGVIWIDVDNENSIKITGPSREAVAQKILAMEQVVGALENFLADHAINYSTKSTGCTCNVCRMGRAALAAWEGKK